MIQRAERESLVAEAERIIRHGSTSFRFASRLFDQPTRERAWLLYAWCRACDDLTDGQVLGHGAVPPADPAARVALARTLTDRALSGEPTGERAFDALALVVEECAIPRRFIDDHLQGFALDAAGWRPGTQADLLLYCYHVAGAVGCMMAVIMGVAPDDEETLRHAADLGMAFQLANIARDIVEDDGVGRIYIPADWLAEKEIVPGTLGEARHRADLAGFAQRLAALAAPYEASARIGAERLPRRSRWAVLSAANIYGDISRKVIARGERAWDSRTVISKWAKLAHVARALR
ncbi:MAG: phytoene/squalene synthase family protein [Sphingomonadaceae bacterium]|nr:phytoene/squalene synthase family protein [Sphingomonadaceae bacterium]